MKVTMAYTIRCRYNHDDEIKDLGYRDWDGTFDEVAADLWCDEKNEIDAAVASRKFYDEQEQHNLRYKKHRVLVDAGLEVDRGDWSRHDDYKHHDRYWVDCLEIVGKCE
jgi:hypothetical protein